MMNNKELEEAVAKIISDGTAVHSNRVARELLAIIEKERMAEIRELALYDIDVPKRYKYMTGSVVGNLVSQLEAGRERCDKILTLATLTDTESEPEKPEPDMCAGCKYTGVGSIMVGFCRHMRELEAECPRKKPEPDVAKNATTESDEELSLLIGKWFKWMRNFTPVIVANEFVDDMSRIINIFMERKTK